MGQGLKKRLLGAGVLVLLLVLLAPSLFKGGDSHSLNTAGEGAITSNADKTPVEEFVDAFVEGITPTEQKNLSDNQQPSDIHASEVIDAYAGIVDKSLQEAAPLETIVTKTDSTLSDEPLAAVDTSIQEQPEAGSDALEAINPEAIQPFGIDTTGEQLVAGQTISETVTDDTAFVVVKDLPTTMDPQTGQTVPAAPIARQEAPEPAALLTQDNSTEAINPQQLANATADKALTRQPVENAGAVITQDSLLTASEAQAAQAAVQSALPRKAPEIPAFVATLDTSPDVVDIQAKEQVPVAVNQAEPGIDDSGSLKAWALQLATFSDKSNAIKLQDALRAKSHTAYIRETLRINGRPLYRVYIGPEVRTEELDTLKAQLEKEMGLSGMVVRFKS